MLNLQGNWIGSISGTNNGDVFIEMRQNNETISGISRINDKIFGVTIYHFDGRIAGNEIIIEMEPQERQGLSSIDVNVNNRPLNIKLPITNFGNVSVRGTIKDNKISGQWTSTIGTGGTFQIARDNKTDILGKMEGTSIMKQTVNPKSIFLSHSSKDKFFVRTLADHLRQSGIKVWLDEAEINIGDSLTEKIGEAIQGTDFVGVVLSHNSINSEWVQRELQVALQKEIKGRRVVVLPILIEQVEIPHFLKDKLYADFTSSDKFEHELQKLLKALSVTVQKEKVIPEIKQPVDIPQRKPAHLIPIERKLTSFEDIKILEIDDTKSYKPDPTKFLFNIYLKLSDLPPSEWQQIFDAERRFPRHTMWRKAWIEGEYIIIHCVPDEIEKYHASDLKEDVMNSNQKYRQYMTEEAQKEAKKTERVRSESNQLKELKQKIKFD
jgi:hypothetical protein